MLTDEQLDSYAENGYLLLPGVLNAAVLANLLDECMAAWGQEKGSFDPSATWLTNALLPDIHHQSLRVLQYYFNDPLLDVAAQLIGPNIKGATSQLTFKMRGNTKPFG